MDEFTDGRGAAPTAPFVPEPGTRTQNVRPTRIEDFRMPRRALSVLLGADAAARLLKRGDAVHGSSPADTHLSTTRFLNHCLEQMQALGDESYGIAPKPIALGTFGMMMATAAQADDLEGAMARLAEAARVLWPDTELTVSSGRDGLKLTFSYKAERSARAAMLSETQAVTVHCALRWLTGRPLKLVQVRTGEPMPGFERTMLRGFIGCPVTRRGEGVTLRYRSADAHVPLAPVKYQNWAVQELGEFMHLLEEAAAGPSRPAAAASSTIVRVREAIAGGARTELSAAHDMGMSPATLRRRLSEEGRSFRAIASDIQRRAVESLIMTDKTLDDISAEIGYSDVRSLRRACQRWFGMSPAEYRQGRRGRSRGAKN